MPHDMNDKELNINDLVVWNKRRFRIAALDSNVCAATVEARGSHYLVPCNRLSLVETGEKVAVA